MTGGVSVVGRIRLLDRFREAARASCFALTHRREPRALCARLRMNIWRERVCV